jgi:hypothetical protein
MAIGISVGSMFARCWPFPCSADSNAEKTRTVYVIWSDQPVFKAKSGAKEAHLAGNEEPVFDLPHLQHYPSHIYPHAEEAPGNHQRDNTADYQSRPSSFADILHHRDGGVPNDTRCKQLPRVDHGDRIIKQAKEGSDKKRMDEHDLKYSFTDTLWISRWPVHQDPQTRVEHLSVSHI